MIRIYNHLALECYSSFYGLEKFISAPQVSFAFQTVWSTILAMDIYTNADRCTMTLTLCMTVPWSRDGVIFFVLRLLLCLLSSPVQTQLTLVVSHWGPGAPCPQSGVPFSRVRAHSLSRVQNTYCDLIRFVTLLTGNVSGRHITY
jgi:hypothetical protein